MLKDIQFCSCSRLYCDKIETQQCMIFSFTPRALKVLSKEYLEKITANPNTAEKPGETLDLNEEKQEETFEEFSSSEFEKTADDFEPPLDFAIYKLDENRWRIAIPAIAQFLASLFRFLPGYFQPIEQKFLVENGTRPVCCLNITANSPSDSNTDSSRLS